MSVRPYRAPLPRYVVPTHPAPVDLVLSGNEGRSPTIDTSFSASGLCRYPSTRALETRLASQWGVDAAQVMVTAGADDALLRAFRWVLGPGRNAVVPWPSFSMLPRFADWVGAELRTVEWTGDDWPLDAVLSEADANTGAIAVVSPNNPTGAVVSPDALRVVSEARPDALILVDAAYAEFADTDLTEVALELPNAVVFRTLSKAWGLAGLRVGYAMGPAGLIDGLRASGLPYPCSVGALELAGRWLDAGQARTAGFVERVRSERAALAGLLEELGARVQSSQGNFVLARFADAPWVADALAGLGIAVRRFDDEPLLADALRITLPGDANDFGRLENALRAALVPTATLYDMDGVLVDVRESYREAIVQTAASYGVSLDHERIAAAKAEGNANNDWVLTQRLLARAGVVAGLDEVTRRFEERYQGGLWKRERALISPEDLASGPLGIVTGRPRRDAERFLETQGLTGRFASVVTMEDAPPKPSPEPVERALEQLGTRSAWLFGDTPDDIAAARSAGVVPIGVLAPGESDADALFAAGAARVVASLKEAPCVA